jgi:hypothetical protein
MYKSTPQSIVAVAGNNLISSVNPLYTRLTHNGPRSSNSGGFVSANRGMLQMVDATHFSLTNPLRASGMVVLVEEFIPGFFRQAFQWGNITIPSGTTQATIAHGLSLGPNAYVIATGSISNRGPDTGGLALAEAQVMADVELSGGNLIASCDEVDYGTNPGNITVGYCLIDPR